MSLNAAENFLHDWAAIGLPVILYPGKGNSVADQLKRINRRRQRATAYWAEGRLTIRR